MAKVQRTEQFYDDELKAKGLKRISVAETVVMNDQYFATVYRERLVKISDLEKSAKTKNPWWKPKKNSKKN
jgi:hypothetical protein